MTEQPTAQITLTVDELKTLIRDAVRDALLEVLGEDMDTEPRFSPDVAARLQSYRQQEPRTIAAADVAKDLDIHP